MCESSFQELKKVLLSSECLHGPDFKRPFILQTDASNDGLGAVLVQEFDGIEHPIAYISRQLNKAEKNYMTTEQECLAVVWACKAFEPYLIDSPFTIITDHAALQWLPTKRFENKRVMGWAMVLSEYRYTVKHRTGKNNANADALSRVPIPDSAPPEPPHLANSPLFAPTISSFLYVSATATRTVAHPQAGVIPDPTPDDPMNGKRDSVLVPFEVLDVVDYKEIVQAQRIDSHTSTIINQLEKGEVPAALDETAKKKFIRHCESYKLIESEGDIPAGLYYLPQAPTKDPHCLIPLTPRLVIPAQYQRALIRLFHDAPFAGHMGVTRTFRRLIVCYYWNTMFDQVHTYVTGCRECQAEKVRRKNPAYVEQRMKDPTEPFDVMSCDIVGPFHQSEDFRYLLTFICHFTKFAIVVPLVNKSAVSVAASMVNEVIARYGSPRVLLSDNGSEFRNQVMAEVCKLLRVHKTFSSAHRPQSHGIIERFNGTIRKIIEVVTHDYKNSWATYLQLMVFAYNTSPGELTKLSPFELVYGRPARLPFLPAQPEIQPRGAEALLPYHDLLKYQLSQWGKYVRQVHDHQQEAVHKRVQTQLTDQVRINIFQPGDQVMVQALRAQGIGQRYTDPVWTGPFKVLRRIGEVNYQVETSGSTARKAHTRTFHVTRLRAYRSNTATPDTLPPRAVPYVLPNALPTPIHDPPRFPSMKNRVKLPRPPTDEVDPTAATPTSTVPAAHPYSLRNAPRPLYAESQHTLQGHTDARKRNSQPQREDAVFIVPPRLLTEAVSMDLDFDSSLPENQPSGGSFSLSTMD